MSKLDHAASLTSSDAAAKQKATLQQRTTNRKSINTGYNVLFLRRKVARNGVVMRSPRRSQPGSQKYAGKENENPRSPADNLSPICLTHCFAHSCHASSPKPSAAHRFDGRS